MSVGAQDRGTQEEWPQDSARTEGASRRAVPIVQSLKVFRKEETLVKRSKPLSSWQKDEGCRKLTLPSLAASEPPGQVRTLPHPEWAGEGRLKPLSWLTWVHRGALLLLLV
jgi:hypothetical protein